MKKQHIMLILVLYFTITDAATETENKTSTISSYDPAELLLKIFNINDNVTIESRQRGYGFKFEDEPDLEGDLGQPESGQYGLLDHQRDQTPLRFEDDYEPNYDSPETRPIKFDGSQEADNHQVVFQDDNNVDGQVNKKKRRRRRRKPKNGALPYPGVGVPNGPGFYGPVQGYGPHPYGVPGYPGGQPFRRPRRPRPRPSIASEALESITGALTSIALYDDYQCVPRLLCEAAGGGALGDSGLLQSISGIQPLLTLLSAYNGISTSPLFVFGRAVFLGMTSKGNTGTCRYAYPQCPTDPEQLIYYLNNHNGGFFRFFNAPQPHQNLEQFYNHLGGSYQPGPNYPIDPSGQGFYGPGNYPNHPNYDHNQGLYQNGYIDPNGQNNGFPGNNRPGLYNNNYGLNYAYDYNNYGSGNHIRFKDNAKIEKRIQNKPVDNFVNENYEHDAIKSKWQFPEDISQSNHYNIRDSRTLKFPEESQTQNSQIDYNRRGKQIYFPDSQNSQHYYNNHNHINNYRYQTTTYSYNNGDNHQNYIRYTPSSFTNRYTQPIKYYNYNQMPTRTDYYNQNYYSNQQNAYNNHNKYPTTVFNNEEYVFDYKHNFYVKKDNYNNYSNNNVKRYEEDGLKTVYVVRGNGDPRQPEVVKLKPGQSINK